MSRKKPALLLVREGNPGHRSRERLEGGLVLAPEAPPEPDWDELFPSADAASVRCRGVAAGEWRRVAGVLDGHGLLTVLDGTVLRDYCVVVARIDQCERDVSIRGAVIDGARGQVKNPSTTFLNQLRGQLRYCIGQLGLSPVARDQMPKTPAADEDSPFD